MLKDLQLIARDERFSETLKRSLRIANGIAKGVQKKMISCVNYNDTNGACYVASPTFSQGIGDARPSPTLRLTLELVTVGDFALPVAGLFVHVKG